MLIILNLRRLAAKRSSKFNKQNYTHTEYVRLMLCFRCHSSSEIGKEAREVLENFAAKLNLDPLQPPTWYHLVRNYNKAALPKVSKISY